MSDNERKETKIGPNNYQEKKKVKYVPGKLLQKSIPDILILEPLLKDKDQYSIAGKLN